MARPRQPIALIEAKGNKHLTKAEIEARTASEVKPCADGIEAPPYLTAAEKKKFNLLAIQLQKIKIMGETDVDTLSRYVVAQSLYEQTVKDIRSAQKAQRNAADLGERGAWALILKDLDKRQDRYFKQAHTCASALGLTITSRCGLEVPTAPKEEKKNKFAKFGADAK